MIKFTLTLQVNGIFGLNHYITGGWACLFIFSVRIQGNEKGEPETVRFYHRRPSFEDYEAFQGDVMRASMQVANQNLIASITLHPAGADVVGELQSCPIALDRWLQKVVLPIFGGDVVEVSSKSL